MNKGLFWLDDLQWSVIEEFVPSRKRRGPRREDDRRIDLILRPPPRMPTLQKMNP